MKLLFKRGCGLFSLLQAGLFAASQSEVVPVIVKEYDFYSSSDVPDYRLLVNKPDYTNWRKSEKLGIRLPGFILDYIDASATRPKAFMELALLEQGLVRAVGSFYHESTRRLLINQTDFASFNTLNEWSLWVDTFGGYEKFKTKQVLDLKENIFGVKACGSRTYDSFLTLGIGAGALFNWTSWEEVSNSKSHANGRGAFFGPYIGCQFDWGYLASQVIACRDTYEIRRKALYNDDSSNNLEGSCTVWDIAVQYEQGIDFALSFANEAFVRPVLYLDYLWTFEEKHSEIDESGQSFHIGSVGTSRLDSKLLVEIRKEFFRPQGLAISPILYAGIDCSLPLGSKTNYEVSSGESSEPTDYSADREWNGNLVLGGSVSVLHPKAFGLKISYESRLLGDHLSQTVHFGLNWEW